MQNEPTAEQFEIPAFVIREASGVAVDLARIDDPSGFAGFADGVFSAGFLFSGIDYAAFQDLVSMVPERLQATLAELKTKHRPALVRFASGIAPFPPERVGLYRSPRIISGCAEYLFEPVMLERTVEEPLFADAGEGRMEMVGKQERVVSEKTGLVFDEFVAAMWLRGIRFGLDAAAVIDMIRLGRHGRLVVARPLPPKPGQDSALKEESDRLYRDNAPRQLSNGKVDLRQFKNRFPQIRKGEHLLRKTPRVPGVTGMDIFGAVLEPATPQDFDLESLVGPGTHVESDAQGEFIVSSLDGFLNIDLNTNRIAVTGKIVNYGGVSMKTTGDISLDGEHFEEHGEIQEKRVVEGRNITVHADVFGRVVSSGGRIHLLQNLVGGSATNQDGDVEIEGLASNATIYAKAGEVRLGRAENSLIVGRNVIVEHAINCTMVGESLDIATMEGCAIAGKSIRVGKAGPRKENHSTISVLVPDLSSFDAAFAALASAMADRDSEIEARQAKIKSITEIQDVRNYLMIGGKLQRKEITLNDEQKANWQKLGQKVAPAMKALSSLNAEVRAIKAEREKLVESGDALESEKAQAIQGISVSVGISTGETVVRKWMRARDAVPLHDMHARDLKIRLREVGTLEDRLLTASGADLEWRYGAPSA